MNKYLLFMGYDFYPSGGWDDFHDSYETVTIAKVFGESALKNDDADWYQVINKEDGQMVAFERKDD